MVFRRAGAISVLAISAGCSLLTSFDGYTGGATSDASIGSIDASPLSDAGVDAVAQPDGALRPRAWRQLALTGLSARHSSRMVYDEARNKLVLFGGGQTWELAGTSWSRVTTTPPTSAGSPGLAYDSARHVTVLSGGANSPPEPWEYDGTTWKSSGGAGAHPGGLYGAKVVFDRARAVLVAFGGYDSTAKVTKGDTWEWTPAGGYVKRAPSVSPPSRSGHVMVYDTARSRVVLFGGEANAFLNDVWEYDGTTWTERTPPSSPPPRVASCGAYDEARGVTVIFGGRAGDNTTAFADTWEWDGTSWRQGPSGPSARRTCAIAYDGSRDAIVLFGGSPSRTGATSNALGDAWVYE